MAAAASAHRGRRPQPGGPAADRPGQCDRHHGPGPFVGTVRQIADEVAACAEIGADEVHLDLQFTPTIRTGRQYLDVAAEVLALVHARVGSSAHAA